MEEMFLEAGFAPSTARQQSAILVPMREAGDFDPIVQAMMDLRKATIEKAKTAVGGASYGALMVGVDILTKNIQLLSGGATDRKLIIQISKEVAIKYNVFAPGTVDNSE